MWNRQGQGFGGTDGTRPRINQKQLPIPPILPMGGSPGRAVCRCQMLDRARASVFRLKEFRASKRYSVIRLPGSSCPIIAMEQWQGSAGQTKVRQQPQPFASPWDGKVATFAHPTALPTGVSRFSCDQQTVWIRCQRRCWNGRMSTMRCHYDPPGMIGVREVRPCSSAGSLQRAHCLTGDRVPHHIKPT